MIQNELSVACVILASGISKRFGKNKLIQLLDNKPLILHIFETCIHAKTFSKIVTVTRWKEVQAFINTEKSDNYSTVLHDLPLVSDTIRLGVNDLCSKNNAPDGIMFCVGDQPFVSIKSIQNLVSVFKKNPECIIRLCFTDSKNQNCRIGNPVIFPKSLFEELQNLPPDESGRYVIQKHKELVKLVEAEKEKELFDADTIEDFKALQKICE